MISQNGRYGPSLPSNTELDPFVSASVSTQDIYHSTTRGDPSILHTPTTADASNLYAPRAANMIAHRSADTQKESTTDAMSDRSYGEITGRTTPSDKTRDSHDLKVGRNITRDSMLHNMVLSFDQFSVPTSSDGRARAHGPIFSLPKSTDDGSSVYSSVNGEEFLVDHGSTRSKGHGYSYSSDHDVVTRSRASSQGSGKGRRSNSTSMFQPGLERINSLRREPPPRFDVEGIQNARVDDLFNREIHREANHECASNDMSTGSAQLAGMDKGFPSSVRSSLDAGEVDRSELVEGMDSTTRTASKLHKVLGYAPGAAPTGHPSKYSYGDPVADLTYQSDKNAPLLSASQMIRQSVTSPAVSRTDSVGTNTSLPPTNLGRDAPLGISDKDYSLLANGAKSKNKAIRQASNSSQQPQTNQRPGFFRRVFGSSSNKAVPAALRPESEQSVYGGTGAVPVDVATNEHLELKPNIGASSPMHQNLHDPSTSTPMPSTAGATPVKEQRESAHILVKKPSSFFRRRKKSLSEAPPLPPAPIQLGPALENVPQEFILREKPSSPDSSLRKVMNPYLASPSPKRTVGTSKTSYGRVDTPSLEPGQEPRSFSPDYTPDKTATIRSVSLTKDNTETTREIVPIKTGFEQSIPSYYPPTSVQQLSDTLRNSIDHQSVSRSRTSGGSINSTRETVERATSPNLPILERIARDIAAVAEYERRFTKTTKLPTSATDQSLQNHLALSTVAQEALKGDDYITQEGQSHINKKDDQEQHDTLASRGNSGAHDAKGNDEHSTQRTTTTPAMIISKDVDVRAPIKEDEERARNIFEGHEDFVTKSKTAAWLGDVDISHQRTLSAYMRLFDFRDLNILASIRLLCGRLILKAESQQVDRILEAFASRWCDCNENHGFKLRDVVHTVCYSVFLLNTDLHLADIDSRMTKSQFVKNTMQTIMTVVTEESPDVFESRPSMAANRSLTTDGDTLPSTRDPKENAPPPVARASTEWERPGGWRSSLMPLRRAVESPDIQKLSALNFSSSTDDCGPLVKAPFHGSIRTWEVQVEIVLKEFYTSIKDDRLPLLDLVAERPAVTPQPQNSLQVFANGVLRRTPSVISKAPSESQSYRGRPGENSIRSGINTWNKKAQSRSRVYNSSTMASSRTSIDDQSSAMWSPSMSSSTWSKPSFGKNHSSPWTDSFSSPWLSQEHQSIGFASAISQAIIREEVGSAGSLYSGASNDGARVVPLLEDESLGLEGPPWAKEGLAQHRQQTEVGEKKAKNRDWSSIFVVIEKGYLTLFSFTSKSVRAKPKTKGSQTIVGGGNWQDNAQNLGSFLLRQSLAAPLAGGYGKRSHVWTLTLPDGASHMFEVGTAEISKEFVTTVNYWAARLSNPPLAGGISNIEYGWSDEIVNNSLVAAITEQTGGSPMTRPETGQPGRPSLHSTIRESMDQGSLGNFRTKLPGDRLMIADWTPPSQSIRSSNLLEPDQLRLLVGHLHFLVSELQKHKALRSAMAVAYAPRSNNSNRALANWERKTNHLSRELIKYKMYVETLRNAEMSKANIYEEREAKKAKEEMERDMAEDDE